VKAHPTSRLRRSEAGSGRREPAPAWQGWLETFAIPFLAIAVGAAIDGRDPFLSNRGFSWLALPPLLAGIQYGSTHGLACGAFQALLLGIASRTGFAAIPDSLAEILLGWLVTGLVAGEFRDWRHRRVKEAESCADHLRRRLEELGRAYLALEISCDQLRKEAPEGSETLCEAIASFRREIGDASGSAALSRFGNRILALFAEHASVRAATLQPIADGVPASAVATIGASADAANDPLVRKAARCALTASVHDEGEGGVLVAVPLVDGRGRAHAVVAIREMPFLALHDETLERLSVIGGRLGDCFVQASAHFDNPPVELRNTGAPSVPVRSEEAA
jgi:polysaccharide biosynthesis protein PelD